jgi:hypothetical protein
MWNIFKINEDWTLKQYQHKLVLFIWNKLFSFKKNVQAHKD